MQHDPGLPRICGRLSGTGEGVWHLIEQGERVGPYEVIRRIGSGGMATVYLANHPKLDRHVAIKLMHDAFQQDDTFLTRFEREARIVAQLDHPHIVPVYDYSDHQGKPFLVMKYIEGKSLRRVLHEAPLPSLAEVLRVLTPIAEALDYAHGQGILHRDVKPSNIILDEDEVPYLTDFGLARIAMAGESTLSQDAILGTPQYLSPEQALGTKNIDGRADLYSLGIILYQMLVGEVPFSADTPFAIIHDHIYRPIPKPVAINPDITPNISRVLEKTLSKEPYERYKTCAEMLGALRQAGLEDGFNTISREHAARAAESIAVYRSKEDAQATTKDMKIAAPISDTYVDSKSLVTEYIYKRGWVWTVAGVILFLVMIAGIAGTVENLEGEAMTRRVMMLQDQVLIRQENLLSETTDISIDEALQIVVDRPSAPAPYLAAASAFWEAGDDERAQQVVDLGRSSATNPWEYELAAGQIALEAAQFGYAVERYGMVLTRVAARGEAQAQVARSIIGETLYNAALDTNLSPQPGVLDVSELAEREAPDLIYFALARILVTRNDLPAAETALEILDDRDTSYRPEYLLVLGDFYGQQGDVEEAISRWEDILELEGFVPLWIHEIVNARLGL